MKKKDLKALYVVEFENTERGLLAYIHNEEIVPGELVIIRVSVIGCQTVEQVYNDDLTCKVEGYDIVKIWGHSESAKEALTEHVSYRELLWERKK